MAYGVEATDGSGYARNQLVFGTREEADLYCRDLLRRWTACVDARVVEVEEIVNYDLRVDDDGVVTVEPRAKTTYKVVRFYRQDVLRREVLFTGLSREEAVKICKDPETASLTATSIEAIRHAEANGPWFCGFEQERS